MLINLSESSGGHQDAQKAAALVLWGEAEGDGLAQPGEETASAQTDRSLQHWQKTTEKIEPGSVLKCRVEGQDIASLTTLGTFWLHIRKKFPHGSSEEQEQVAQRGGEISIFGVFQDSAPQTCAGGGSRDHSSSLSTWMVLWFCNCSRNLQNLCSFLIWGSKERAWWCLPATSPFWDSMKAWHTGWKII